MGFKEDYIFWQTIHTLTHRHGYIVITMSDDQREIWLEHNENRKYSVLRFMRLDFDWANMLKRDLGRTASNGENIRKQLFKKPVKMLNVYFSVYEPVDEYESYLKETPVNNKLTIESKIIDSVHLEEGLGSLGSELGVQFESGIPDDVEEFQVENMRKAAIQAGLLKRKEEQEMFQHGKPVFTKVFLTIQIVLFILMELVGSSESTATLLQFGAKHNFAILAGEWWRFITPVFLHIGILHLLMNSVALLYIGGEVEKIFGSIRFSLIYLFAGFAGVLGSFLFNDNLSAGASGAIFGCFGALLYFGAMYPKLFFRTMGTNIIALVVINTLFGFMFPGIDNAGHLGGLIGGFAAAAAVGVPKKWKPLSGLLIIVILIACTWWLLDYGYAQAWADYFG